MDNGFSPADFAAVARNDGNGWGGDGGWMALIILFALIGNGGFGWGGNRNGEPVTESGLCNANNFVQLENAVGRGFDQQSQFAFQNQRDMCTSTATLSAQIAENRAAAQQCCCETQRAIDGVNYNGAINTASVSANIAEGTQKVLDAITGNRMADMQNQINQLQLQAALCGVVRWPQQATWNGGQVPFFNNCSCNTGCCNI